MKINHDGKEYKATRDVKTAELFIKMDKKKVFAGFGKGCMVKGFSLVQDNAPKKAGESHG